MKHISSYSELNERKLRPDEKRALKLLPQALYGFIQRFLGIYPLINTKWKELKRSTIGYKDSPFSTGTDNKVDFDFTEIKADILPDKLRKSMFFKTWKVYLKSNKSRDGRDVIYITKDNIEKGDIYKAYRLNDFEIYKGDKGAIIILIAKFDNQDKVAEVKNTVDDICLELEDDLPVSVKPYFSKYQDYLGISIKINKDYKPSYIKFSNVLSDRIADVMERVKSYLKQEGYDFNYKIGWVVKSPFYYQTDKNDRFRNEIIPAAKEYDFRYNEYNKIWSREFNALDISKCVIHGSSNQTMMITSDDIKIIFDNMDSTFTRRITRRNGSGYEYDRLTYIPIQEVYIIFDKVN